MVKAKKNLVRVIVGDQDYIGKGEEVRVIVGDQDFTGKGEEVGVIVGDQDYIGKGEEVRVIVGDQGYTGKGEEGLPCLSCSGSRLRWLGERSLSDLQCPKITLVKAKKANLVTLGGGWLSR